MKVVYDHQIFAAMKYGGVARYYYELAKRVNAFEDISASIVAPLYLNRYLREGGAHVQGMRIPAVPRTGTGVRLINECITAALFRISPPDLIHETYYRPTSLAPKGCPVVITVHDMIHEKFKRDFANLDQTSA